MMYYSEVPIVTKRIRLCANGPFRTLFSLIQPDFMAKAAGRVDIYLFIFLSLHMYSYI